MFRAFGLLVVLFASTLFVDSSVEAAPPWRTSFRAQRELMRAQLEMQQATMAAPKAVYQQQKAWLRQQEKTLRDDLRSGRPAPPPYGYQGTNVYSPSPRGQAPVYAVPMRTPPPVPGQRYVPNRTPTVYTYSANGRTYTNVQPPAYRAAPPRGAVSSTTPYSISQPTSIRRQIATPSRPPAQVTAPYASYPRGVTSQPSYGQEIRLPNETPIEASTTYPPVEASEIRIEPYGPNQVVEYSSGIPTTSVVTTEPTTVHHTPSVPTVTSQRDLSETMPEPIPAPEGVDTFQIRAPVVDDGPQPTPAVRPAG
jgi:hypothetical protein